MSDNPTVTREECEAIVNRPPVWLCTKCGWHGADTSQHLCTYSPIDCGATEKRLARAYLDLLDQQRGLMARIRQLDMRQGELLIERDGERERCARVVLDFPDFQYELRKQIAAVIRSGE